MLQDETRLPFVPETLTCFAVFESISKLFPLTQNRPQKLQRPLRIFPVLVTQFNYLITIFFILLEIKTIILSLCANERPQARRLRN